MPNSHEKPPDRLLGTAVRGIEQFLTDTANLPDAIDYPDDRCRKPFARWQRRWRSWFAFHVEKRGRRKAVQVPVEHLELFAPIVRTTLRRLWVETDAHQREWYCYRLRDAHRQMVRHLEGWAEDTVWGGPDTVKRITDYALQGALVGGPFEAAICWAQHQPKRFLRCGNPLCEAEYFLRSPAAKMQTFCSPECAEPARRAAKLRWWNENRRGPELPG